MSAYVTPERPLIASTTGINFLALGIDNAELGVLIGTLRSRAEADVAGQVTDAFFDSLTLTARQATVLQEAVCYGVAARFLSVCRLKKADGTYEPLLVEDSRSIGEIIKDFMDEQNRLAEVAAGGDGSVIVQIKSSFNSDTDAELQFSRGTVW